MPQSRSRSRSRNHADRPDTDRSRSTTTATATTTTTTVGPPSQGKIAALRAAYVSALRRDMEHRFPHLIGCTPRQPPVEQYAITKSTYERMILDDLKDGPQPSAEELARRINRFDSAFAWSWLYHQDDCTVARDGEPMLFFPPRPWAGNL